MTIGVKIVKAAGVGAIDAPPTAEGHVRLIGRRNPVGQQLFGRSLNHAVEQSPKAADPGDEIHPLPPEAVALGRFVGQDFIHDASQLFVVIRSEAADGEVGDFVVIQIGIPVVGADLRFRAKLDIHLGRHTMSRHAASPDHGIGLGRGLGIADEKDGFQLAALGGSPDGVADLIRGPCIRYVEKPMSLGVAVGE